jgi:gluconolactonase
MKWWQGNATVFRENSNGASGLTFDHQGRLLACEKGRVTRQEKDGKITTLADKGLRDIVYAIDGSIYFTDKSKLYQITPKGVLRVATDECQAPSGVALSPTQQKLYVSDGKVRVFDIAADGALRNGRLFVDVAGPAGLKSDESGSVWVAAPGGIWVFDPHGKHLETIQTPEPPSNLSWGDGFRNLYITAATSIYKLQTKANGTRTF